MARAYQHFCPVARALEKIGDKWSLLIVRDLLRRPQRFTDLLRYSRGITPKWLTVRLRELETAGIVQRDSEPGRREVWYHLTPAGRDLAPVLETLASWGLRYAMRPPLPGETIDPELTMSGVTFSFNRRGRRLSQPATWTVRFTPGGPHSLSFDGNCWSTWPGEEANPDVTVTTTPEAWATFLTVGRGERAQLLQFIQIDGVSERVQEFLQTFGVRDDVAE